MAHKEEMIKEYLRKNFLKFYIIIYKDQPLPVPSARDGRRSSAMGSSSLAATPGGNMGSGAMSSNTLDDAAAQSKYMLDIHLFKGTVNVFMDFIHKFIHLITLNCNVCVNPADSSYCSSSNHSVVEAATLGRGAGGYHIQ